MGQGNKKHAMAKHFPPTAVPSSLLLFQQSRELHERFLLGPCISCAVVQRLCAFTSSPKSLISRLENAVLTVHRPWNGEWRHHWAWEQKWLQPGQSAVGGRGWPSPIPSKELHCASLPWSAGKLQERTRPCSSSPPGSLHTSLAEAGSNYTKPQQK